MKKRSFFWSIGLILSLSLLGYSYWQMNNALKDQFAKITLQREKQVLAYLDLARQYNQPKQLDHLQEILQGAVEVRLIDWFLVRYQGKPVYSAPEGTDQVNDISEQPDYAFITPLKSYQSIELGPDLLLTIGINKKIDAYTNLMISQNKNLILQDMAVPVILVLLLMAFFLRDILNMIKAVSVSKSADRSATLAQTKARSKEAQVLQDSLQGYEDIVGSMDKERLLLRQVVLPSMKRELSSGRRPPYDFLCTLVRMDINHFSHMFALHDREALLTLINDYFVEVTQVVNFYGGYVHEFVGDEVLFYFKDDECPNSLGMALACVRDVFAVTEKHSQFFQVSLGESLTVKVAASQGELRFGPLVDSFSLAGRPLIETVRDLSQVTSRDDNRCYLSSVELKKTNYVCRTDGFGQFDLRGIPDPVDIYLVSEFFRFADVFESVKKGRYEALAYYRSPADVDLVLEWCLSLFRNQAYAELELLLHGWLSCSPGRLEGQQLVKLDKLMNKLSGGDKFVLGCERVFARLIAQWGKRAELREVLDGFAAGLLKSPDADVIGSAILYLREAPIKKAGYNSLRERFGKILAPQVRTQLLLLGLAQHYEPSQLNILESMLRSRDSHEVELAQQALSEIILNADKKDKFKSLPPQAIHQLEEMSARHQQVTRLASRAA